MDTRKRTSTSVSSIMKNITEMDNENSDCREVMLSEQIPEETEPARGNWTGRFDFLLSLLGYSVGLGNVWRFPYLCYNNGGGAFLIPFTVMLIIAGLPLMFMELSFGQYAALGPVAVYNRFCPLFRGLGYGMVIVSSIVMLYYNLIIAWTFYYIYVSFVSIFYQLPWQNCDAEWSTKYCYSYEAADECKANNGTYYLRECFNHTQAELHNITALANVTLRRPPAEEYFSLVLLCFSLHPTSLFKCAFYINHVLGLSSGIQEIGGIRWSLAACLFAAWVIVFLCLCKGVQSSGKVVYFTALFPYVVLVILFFRGVTLPGASTGIIFYLTPDFSQLANAQVWGDAAVQIFFALSPAWGGLITLSSYNKFSNNCYLDSLIVAVSNIATSFFAGLVIFSVIGFLAHELHVSVDRVVDQGAGLAFIVYPEVVTRLPLSPLWSILFFFMLLTLGLDSQFALMETVTTAILDRFPNFREKKVWVVLTVAVFGYIGGLVFTTNSGMYWLQLMDKYAANWSVLIIAIGECILIAWIYGAEKFCHDIERMIGRQSKTWVFFWSTMWRGVTPAALIFILAFNWIEYKPATYGHYVYPMWADAVGWIIGMLPILIVILMAIDKICTGPDDLTIMQTSKDTGDTMSVNSGVDNDFRKSGVNTKKRNSIKKKVQNFSGETDDAALVPLLRTHNERDVQSAKFPLPNTKTDSLSDQVQNIDVEKSSISNNLKKNTHSNIMNENNKTGTIVVCNPAVIHNHMNTNVFGNMIKSSEITPKTSILIEISENKTISTTPLIFTTAKIHTDNKSKATEPLPIIPVPILSTIEGNLVKSEVTSYNDNKMSGKIEATTSNNDKTSISVETHFKDSVQQPTKLQTFNEQSDRIANETNQLLSTKASLNKFFASKVTTAQTPKTLINTTSVTVPPLQSNATRVKTTKSEEPVTRTDTVYRNVSTINTVITKEVSNNTIASKTKPESTNSIKKLQRQKHTEDTPHVLTSSPQPTNLSTMKIEPDSKIKSSDLTPKTNINNNGSAQPDKSDVKTKLIASLTVKPLSDLPNQEKSVTESKVTTVNSIYTIASSSKSATNTTSKDDARTPIIATKPAFIMQKDEINTKSVNKSVEKTLPITSVATSIKSKPSDLKLKSPSQVRTPSPGSSVNVKASSSKEKESSASKLPVTPSYIVATSKTKIGGPSTSNKSLSSVTSPGTVTTISTKPVYSKSGADEKQLDTNKTQIKK